jgi:NAD(P)H-hydrate repair Nnr-like enzyme with NAD(P)H-hydrate epimerase domain
MRDADTNELPLEIYSVDAVRQIDRAAIDGGIKGYVLMTRAAESALQVARARYPDTRRWQVICGSGNNAGDGYVLARLAAQQGIAVSVLAVSSPEKLTGDAESAYMDFFASGGGLALWAFRRDTRQRVGPRRRRRHCGSSGHDQRAPGARGCAGYTDRAAWR